jgi:hypothetical protein
MKSYNEALSHYDSIAMPPRSKKWKSDVMHDNGKPLRRTSEPHMAIHKRDSDGAIYYRLYNTNILTLYPPQADGTERRTFKYVGTQTTSTFMYDYHLNCYQVNMDDDTQACVPYVTNGGWSDNDMLTADMVFDTEGRVIRSRSSHKDVYTMVSSPDDKQKRKEFKQRLESLITLASFNMPNLIDNVHLDGNWGAPFGTQYHEPHELAQLKQYVRQNGASVDDNHFIEHFMAGVQGAFNVYASKLAYNAGTYGYASFWHIDNEEERRQANTKFQEEQLAKRIEIVRNIDDKNFRKSLTDMLLSASGIKTGTVKKPWGQFMPTLPCNYITD